MVVSDEGVTVLTEFWVGVLGFSCLGICAVSWSAARVWQGLRSLFCSMSSSEPRKPWKVVLWETFLRPWATNSGPALFTVVLTLLLSIIIAAIVLPIPVVFLRRGETFSYLDGFGPEVNGSQPNLTVWSDCFTIRTPTDKLGFWDYWRKEKGHEAIDHFVAVL